MSNLTTNIIAYYVYYANELSYVSFAISYNSQFWTSKLVLENASLSIGLCTAEVEG